MDSNLIFHFYFKTSSESVVVLFNHKEEKRVHAFLKGINPKMNVIVQLEFEFVYYDVTVEHFNHSSMKTGLKLNS